MSARYDEIFNFAMSNLTTLGGLETLKEMYRRWPDDEEIIGKVVDHMEAIVGVIARDWLREAKPAGSA